MTGALRVLVVDDERLSRATTVEQLLDAGYVAEAADGARQGLALLDRAPYDVVLTDLRMPEMDGLVFLQEIRARFPEVDVLLMTAYATVESAVAAMQGGAVDYLTKPFRFQQLDARLRQLAELRGSRRELARLRALLDEPAATGLIGTSPAMAAVRERIRLFAGHGAPILVTGETGTGKELVARALHLAGPRARAPFVAVACGAVPHELAESELFGHERGAFTGAVQRRRGAFEQADGGTLLLDDIDDLPLDLQAKLVRALQESRFTRVGGDKPVAVDIRVIATTKVELEEASVAGRFRQDLYYRLRGLEIGLPPLRARGDDVLLLAQHFLRTLSVGGASVTLATECGTALRSYGWPGNVRELKRSMEAASVLAAGGPVRLEHLPEAVRRPSRAGAKVVHLELDGVARVNLPDVLRAAEDELIAWALDRAGGSQGQAAELLGIPRTTLQSKMRGRS